MTATEAHSLSLEPASLFVCVNRSASIFSALAAKARFCVNVLSAEQVEVAQRCGGRVKGEARFEVGGWREHASGLPYLPDAPASIFCDPDAVFHYGTHGIFVGRVFDVRLGPNCASLIYANGQYGAIGA